MRCPTAWRDAGKNAPYIGELRRKEAALPATHAYSDPHTSNNPPCTSGGSTGVRHVQCRV